MAKHDLQVFLEMNQADTKNGTQYLKMGLDAVEFKKVAAGTVVSMGIGGDHVAHLTLSHVIPVLLLVDRNEYRRLKNAAPETPVKAMPNETVDEMYHESLEEDFDEKLK